MPEIEWDEAPAEHTQKSKWEGVVKQLREYPGRWAKLQSYGVKSSASNQAGELRRRYPDCEFATRTVGREYAIYGRCVESNPTEVTVETEG